MTARPSTPRAYEVPSEIWYEILRSCSIEDVVRLEQACHFFRDLISSRHFWLQRLQNLDQLHAPDLPPHVAISSLSLRDARDFVVRARRRVINSTGSAPLRVRREVIIPIGQTNVDGILGEPFGWGTDTLLLPGGRYFFMRWAAGYLQCWDVETKECMWTYPEIPEDRSDLHQAPMRSCVACDVQINGDVHVSVVSETRGVDQRTLEILKFSPSTRTLEKLFEISPVELDVFHGVAVIAKLCGDIALVYTEGYCMVVFWRENRCVVITDGIFDAIEIVDEYIIGVTGSYEGNTLVAIPIPYVHSLSDTHVELSKIPVTSRPIKPPPHWLVGRAQLSVCKFHWREQTERQEIAVTVLGDVYNDENFCDFPVAEFFTFSFNKSEQEQTKDANPVFTSLGQPRYPKFEAQYSTYSILTPPSQAGSTVVAFHDDRNHETRFARILATYIPGQEVAVRVLDESIVRGKPATYSLNVEFFSGAIHYVTSDYENVVIRYLD